MKKIITAFALTLLLTACNNATDSTNHEDKLTDIELSEDIFITLSAEILCLPTNNSEANATEIESLAKQILLRENVSEESFSVYQHTIETDPDKRAELSLTIVGKMSDFCTVAELVESEETEKHTDEAEEVHENIGNETEDDTKIENIHEEEH
jgi:hypothetical protein